LKINNLNDVLVTIPMPNLYFTRDTFSSVGNSIVVSSMKHFIRKRETIFAWFIFTYHPIYKNTEKLLERDAKNTIEGGDVFPINSETLMIGCSERTQLRSIKNLAQKIVNSVNTHFKKIYVVNVPHLPNLMHLDTWLTNVDYTKFIYSPNIRKSLKL
jgi:arginine deiminase